MEAARVAIYRAVVWQTIIVAGDRLAMGRALLTRSGATIVKVTKLARCAWAAVGVARHLSEAHVEPPARQRRAPALHKVGYLIDSADAHLDQQPYEAPGAASHV